MEDTVISTALAGIGMVALAENFKKERIDGSMVKALTDSELSRLGLSTIGTRHQFKKAVNDLLSVPNRNLRDEIRNERSVLFQNSLRASRNRIANKKQSNTRTWTMQFLCLSDKNQERAPSAVEKEILNKAGLGCKKIQLNKDDDERDVIEKLVAEELNAEGEPKGFPQLRKAGGFELLRRTQNNKGLCLIDCRWNAKELKKNVNSQANIYIRPIQKSLSTAALEEDSQNENIRTACSICNCEFPIRELREHIQMCSEEQTFHVYVGGEQQVNLNAVVEQSSAFTSENIAMASDSTEPSVHVLSTNSPEPPMHTIQTNLVVSEMVTVGADSHIGVGNDQPSVEIQRPVEPSVYIIPNNVVVSEMVTVDADSHTEVINSSVGNDEPSVEIQREFDDLTPLVASGETLFIEDEPSYDKIITHCIENHIVDPVDILRFLQTVLVKGRPLDIEDETTSLEGATNYILVDRNNLLKTGMDEISFMDNPRLTLEVAFYGEKAIDYGGPRKEFFRLILQEIYDKYFEHGLRPFAEKEYEIIGKIIAMSILQNGKIPKFLPVDDIFSTSDSSPCVKAIRDGLDALGIYKVGSCLPSFLHLFRINNERLTKRRLCSLLDPEFSEEGSNRRTRENDIYRLFVKYLCKAAEGSRGSISLEDVLKFATGADQEPILGFRIHPKIVFVPVTNSFLPTSNTCTNCLYLPCASQDSTVPDEEILFGLYDYAFSNTYYGSA